MDQDVMGKTGEGNTCHKELCTEELELEPFQCSNLIRICSSPLTSVLEDPISGGTT